MGHRLAPRFLDSTRGRILLTEWIPERPAPGAPLVIVLPPFAEEMNRSRRALACHARTLATRGIGTAIFDLFGTGDSAGDFGDADWDTWRGDVRSVIGHFADQGRCQLAVLALRSGALLAGECFAAQSTALRRAVLWAPLVDGKPLVRQMLRLHVAASMSAEGSGATTRDLERRLAAGESVEIAGYGLRPELVAALERASLRDLKAGRIPRIDWVEVVAVADQPASPASVRGVKELTAAGLEVELRVVHDQPFWSLPEITIAPRLDSLTADLFAEGFGVRGH